MVRFARSPEACAWRISSASFERLLATRTLNSDRAGRQARADAQHDGEQEPRPERPRRADPAHRIA